MTDGAPPFAALLGILHQHHGVDFAGYQPASLTRRIRHRMEQVGIADDAAYVDYLAQDPHESTNLFATIMIKHTSFFRDAEVWRTIAGRIIPQLLASRPPDAPLRIWSAGCATGQEVYSLAMVLAEHLGMANYAARVSIFATDVDEAALRQVREGRYDAWGVRQVPPPLLERYFVRDVRRYTVRADLRRAVVVWRHNLIDDAPLAGIDLLLCRNTLLYFTGPAQARALAHVHAALAPDGVLVLGRTETTLYHHSAFRWLDLEQRIAARAPALPNPAGPRGRHRWQ